MILLGAGASVNLQDNEGHTALHWATMTRNPIIVQELLHAGASLNMTDIYGNTALILAVTANDMQISKILLDGGEMIDHQNHVGE
ncbi:ankyrin repeat protein [Penaeus vannamei]|uniref:Ankyrin repeat protein n=1 Tax=Penaeus vannamei TaxID=6689 RepID=A0A423THA9_PENVA|nr:ankyrin repeat protein [Penaeus vannamei]